MPRHGATERRESVATRGANSRRNFMKKAGMVGLLGGASTIAGCSGDGGDGGDGGGDGGDGGDGGSTGGNGDRPELSLLSFPLNIDAVLHNYIDREGILEQYMDDAGYDYTLEYVFEDIPLFVSGEADHVNMGTLETCRLAVERDMPLAQCGRIDSTFYGPQVKAGSDLALENSGGIEESLNMIANEDRRLAILGWGIGYIPAEQVFMSTQFDLEFSEEGGDFTNVITADPGAIPNLIIEEDIAAGMIAPTTSPAEAWYNDEIEPLYWDTDALIEAGLGNPHLSGPVFKQETVEEHREGIQAYLDALEEGGTWFYDEGGKDEVPQDEELRDRLNSPNEEIAQYQCNWLAAWYTGDDVKYALDNVTAYRNPKLNDEWIEEDRTYVNNAHEFGLVADGWSEDLWGDMVTHEKF